MQEDDGHSCLYLGLLSSRNPATLTDQSCSLSHYFRLTLRTMLPEETVIDVTRFRAGKLS